MNFSITQRLAYEVLVLCDVLLAGYAFVVITMAICDVWQDIAYTRKCRKYLKVRDANSQLPLRVDK